jgi:hypothetical protein
MIKTDSQKILNRLNQAFKAFPSGDDATALDTWHEMLLEGISKEVGIAIVDYIITTYDTINKSHNLMKIFADAYRQVQQMASLNEPSSNVCDCQSHMKEQLGWKVSQLWIMWRDQLYSMGFHGGWEMKKKTEFVLMPEVEKHISAHESSTDTCYRHLKSQVPDFARTFTQKYDEKIKKIYS